MVWVGGRAGVFRFPPGGGAPLPSNAGLPHLCTHSLAVDADGARRRRCGLAPTAALPAGTASAGCPRPGRRRRGRGLAVDALLAGGRQLVGGHPRRRAVAAAGRPLAPVRRRGGPGLAASDGRCCATAAGRLWVATRQRQPGLAGRRPLPRLWRCRHGCAAIGSRRWPRTPRAGCGSAPNAAACTACPIGRSARSPPKTACPATPCWGLTLDGRRRHRDGGHAGPRRLARAPARSAAASRCPARAGLPCSECWDFSPSAAAAGAFWAVCQANAVLRWDGQAMTRFPPLPGGLPAASFAIEASDGARLAARWTARWCAATAGRATHIARAGAAAGATASCSRARAARCGSPPTTALVGLARGAQPHPAACRRPSVRPRWRTSTRTPGGTLWMAHQGRGHPAAAPGGRIATVGVAHGLPTGWIVQLLEDDAGAPVGQQQQGHLLGDPARAGRGGRRPARAGASQRVRRQRRRPDAGRAVRAPGRLQGRQGRLWFATNGGRGGGRPAAPAPAPRAVAIEQLRLGGQRDRPARRADAGR